MKKLAVAITVVSVFVLGAVAFAHGPGWGGYGMGYGSMMMGPGYGGQMMGQGGYDQKFLDETVDLRKELHEKRFEYMEALRDPKTDKDTIAKIEKEIDELQDKIVEKAPRTARMGYGGYPGRCW